MIRKKNGNSKIVDSVIDLIGNTPMIRLNKIGEHGMAEIIGKIESFNPGGNVKEMSLHP
ncbi:MAG: hypothetical protein NZ841_07780 [Dictyoglomus sp.]|nr:hypothetical protein [Dictyoglomus sp.]MDW8189179.1 hypothetical protein [Dictyoglomus sp.]